MRLQLKPANKLTYKLRLTPQMRLAISLLQMPLVKLKDYVKQQVEENPLLEIDPVRNTKSLEGEDKISNGVNYSLNEDEEEKQNYRESLITKTACLSEHLLRQLYLFVADDEPRPFCKDDKLRCKKGRGERKIGEVIIANIDDNGYLKSTVEEIANSTQATRTGVEKVLSLVQTFDPIGVGARDLRECLLLQIKAKGEENSLVGQIIDKYLPYLEKKRFEFIAKKLSATKRGGSASGGKVTVERIKEAIKEITNLEPKPGRSFNPHTKDFGVGVNTERTIRLIPDVILNPVRSNSPKANAAPSVRTSNGVKRNNDTYEVMLNDWELPSLNLNPKYKRMLKQKDVAEDTKEYLKERLKAAKFLLNAINKRKETIRKVTEAIVYIQKDFLDNGMQELKPMTLSQIANLVGKHKSTVSRTVSNKYLQTPDGIFELRHFLNSGVKQENGEFYSSKAIRAKIKELIENESKENPLTDQQVANHFKEEGISISRRTIAKYRHQLKILSSQSRRE